MANQQRYSFTDTLKENTGLSVYNTGYEKCESNHQWGPALRDHYLIHYVSSGCGTFIHNRNAYCLSAGDLFLISPGELVSYCADENDPWEYCWVGFNGTDARRLVAMAGFDPQKPILHQKNDETRQYILSIAEVSGNSNSADAAMVGRLYLLLSYLIQTSSAKTSMTRQEYVANAMRFIQYNYANNISVSDIASYVGISRSQLYRAFLQDFGISPHDYLKKYRINEACSLLHNPGISVAEAAASVGFNDPLYFSRVFKSFKGCAPSVYQTQKIYHTD